MKKNLILLLLITAQVHLFAQQELESVMTLSPFDDYRFEIQAGGDINGDGYDDIVVAERVEGFELPQVAIYFGSNPPSTSPDMLLTEENNFIRGGYGASISYNGDLNGDGIDDLVISDNNYTVQSAGCWGRLYIYFGSTDFDAQADIVLDGINYVDDWWFLGFGVTNISGDINGDGIDDLVVSALGPTFFFPGHIFVFFGGNEFDTECDWHKEGAPLDHLGYDYSIGNINGDAYDDIIVIRQRFEEDNVPVEIYTGGSVLQMEPVWSTMIQNCGEFHMLSAGGDINGDGYDDIVGAISYDDSTKIIFGAENFVLNESLILPVSYPFITNINNDGYDDIGYFGLNSEENIEVRICAGSEDFDIEYDYFVENGRYANRGFPCGDIKNDGSNDILVFSGSIDLEWYWEVFALESDDAVNSNNSLHSTSNSTIETYPNPFIHQTSISLDIAHAGQKTEISIYNVKGQLVKTLQPSGSSKGQQTIIWDGTNSTGRKVSSGFYFCRVRAGDVEYTKKILMYK